MVMQAKPEIGLSIAKNNWQTNPRRALDILFGQQAEDLALADSDPAFVAWAKPLIEERRKTTEAQNKQKNEYSGIPVLDHYGGKTDTPSWAEGSFEQLNTAHQQLQPLLEAMIQAHREVVQAKGPGDREVRQMEQELNAIKVLNQGLQQEMSGRTDPDRAWREFNERYSQRQTELGSTYAAQKGLGAAAGSQEFSVSRDPQTGEFTAKSNMVARGETPPWVKEYQNRNKSEAPGFENNTAFANFDVGGIPATHMGSTGQFYKPGEYVAQMNDYAQKMYGVDANTLYRASLWDQERRHPGSIQKGLDFSKQSIPAGGYNQMHQLMNMASSFDPVLEDAKQALYGAQEKGMKAQGEYETKKSEANKSSWKKWAGPVLAIVGTIISGGILGPALSGALSIPATVANVAAGVITNVATSAIMGGDIGKAALSGLVGGGLSALGGAAIKGLSGTGSATGGISDFFGDIFSSASESVGTGIESVTEAVTSDMFGDVLSESWESALGDAGFQDLLTQSGVDLDDLTGFDFEDILGSDWGDFTSGFEDALTDATIQDFAVTQGVDPTEVMNLSGDDLFDFVDDFEWGDFDTDQFGLDDLGGDFDAGAVTDEFDEFGLDDLWGDMEVDPGLVDEFGLDDLWGEIEVDAPGGFDILETIKKKAVNTLLQRGLAEITGGGATGQPTRVVRTRPTTQPVGTTTQPTGGQQTTGPNVVDLFTQLLGGLGGGQPTYGQPTYGQPTYGQPMSGSNEGFRLSGTFGPQIQTPSRPAYTPSPINTSFDLGGFGNVLSGPVQQVIQQSQRNMPVFDPYTDWI